LTPRNIWRNWEERKRGFHQKSTSVLKNSTVGGGEGGRGGGKPVFVNQRGGGGKKLSKKLEEYLNKKKKGGIGVNEGSKIKRGGGVPAQRLQH